MLLMHSFCTLHIRIEGCHKKDITDSNVNRNEHISDVMMTYVCLCSVKGVFKTYEPFIFLRASNTKMNLSKRFSKVFK